MSTKAVIFDKDGTVLDFDALWIPVAVKATEAILRKLKADKVPPEKILKSIGVSGDVSSINGSFCYGTYRDMAVDMRAVFSEYGYNFDIEMLTKLTVDAYHESISAGEIKPACDDIAEVFSGLRERGIMTVLVTSDGPAMTADCLSALGLSNSFDLVITDDGTHPNKPDPFIINKLCEDYGFLKSEVIMVGDTLADMNFAKNGEIRGIGISKTIENKAILFSATDTVIYDISWLFTVI